MKITKIEVTPFGIPIKDFADAYAGFTSSNAVLVKIQTDEGTVGIGEACAWVGSERNGQNPKINRHPFDG